MKKTDKLQKKKIAILHKKGSHTAEKDAAKVHEKAKLH